METIFINGGEYVDRQTYIQTRDENSALRERITELEYAIVVNCDLVYPPWCDLFDLSKSQ
jgi:hypothetical protein